MCPIGQLAEASCQRHQHPPTFRAIRIAPNQWPGSHYHKMRISGLKFSGCNKSTYSVGTSPALPPCKSMTVSTRSGFFWLTSFLRPRHPISMPSPLVPVQFPLSLLEPSAPFSRFQMPPHPISTAPDTILDPISFSNIRFSPQFPGSATHLTEQLRRRGAQPSRGDGESSDGLSCGDGSE